VPCGGLLRPAVKEVAADAEFLGDLVDGLAKGEQFNSLGFELGGVGGAGFEGHGLA